MLAALSVGAYIFFARSTYESLEPLMALPEGQAAYAAALHRIAVTLAVFDVPLAALVGVAAYVLARVSVLPLLSAREREERFAADAAHELRTPLATIAAVAQAARTGDAATQSHALARITDVAVDASRLLGDLLALLRQEPDDARLREPVDLAALLAEVIREARERGSRVPIVLGDAPDAAYVIGDERALRQVFHNLVDNAVRHGRAGVAAEVRAESRAIVVAVEDDGDGVAPRDRERIFERFFKADPASPGNGLGLAICRHVVIRHGGSITLEAPARFVARFPRAAL